MICEVRCGCFVSDCGICRLVVVNIRFMADSWTTYGRSSFASLLGWCLWLQRAHRDVVATR